MTTTQTQSQLILVRHCRSNWNDLNLFTGWINVPLSKEGLQEAHRAGQLLKDRSIDIVFTSDLIRAQMTAAIICSYTSNPPLIFLPKEEISAYGLKAPFQHNATISLCPTITAWQLNERCYGDLQGLNKEETAAKYGAEQVHQWRRSYDVAPPNGESLEMTAARAIPYFEQHILPQLKAGKNVCIAAHGNSLRAIIMYLEKWTPEEILHFEFATGAPRIYDYHHLTESFQFKTQLVNEAL